MTEMFWSIRLRLTAMIKEIKWNISIRRQDAKSIKESISMVSRFIMIYAIIILSYIVKIFHFIKNMIMQKLIFIPLTIILILFGLYSSFINGHAKDDFFNEKIFPKFYYDTAIEIRDEKDRFAGTMANPGSSISSPTLFTEKVPSLFWSLLKEKYDPKLNFDSNATSFYEALFEDTTYYNGIDISAPLINTKRLISQMITEHNLNFKPTLTLTQQLINTFIDKHPFDKNISSIERLKLAKTFFHKLKANNGSMFKSWLLSQKDFFIIDKKTYGLKDSAEIFFGKSVDDLSTEQEIILVAMYDKPYQLNQSIKDQKNAWKSIKEDAIEVVNTSKIIQNPSKVISNIKHMNFPKIPYLSDSLMEVIGQVTPNNKEQFSSLPTRSDVLLKSSKAVLRQDLDKLFKTYNISLDNKLVTQSVINFELNNNFYFNHYLKNKIASLNLSNVWVSVVNDKGKAIRLYQKSSMHQITPRIGNIGKIFSSLLFADRGDTFYTQYCNKNAEGEIDNEIGSQKCNTNSWVDAQRLFASNKMLPLYDGYIKYKQKDTKGDNTYYKPIYTNKIEALYQNLELFTLENNEPRSDLGAGKLQIIPLDVQRSLHKITHLLYNPNHTFYGLKLIKSFVYHDIDNYSIDPKAKFVSLDSPEPISPTFQNFFTKEKRVTLQTIFSAPIYKNYGTLQWLKNYLNVKFIFAQESHQNGMHWLVGAFKKSNRYYSFTIFIEDKNLDTYKVKHQIKEILKTTIESINDERKMKFEYMKEVFND